MSDADDFTPRKTIVLVKPISSPFAGKPTITEVVLKEPSGGIYRKLGEPRILVRAANGGAYFVEQNEAISSYLDHCVEHDVGGQLIDMLSLADAMRVKMGLFGFFTDAEAMLLPPSSTASFSA